jgi:hypothetical protein
MRGTEIKQDYRHQEGQKGKTASHIKVGGKNQVSLRLIHNNQNK